MKIIVKMQKSAVIVGMALLLFIAPFTGQAEAASATDLIKSAKSHFGVKYVYGGSTTSGFDCSG